VSELVEFPLESGGTVLVDVAPDSARSPVRRGLSTEGLVTRADQTLEAALTRVKPAAAALVEGLRSVADPPDQIEVTFGIRLSGEAGAVVAKTAAEANFSVALRWSRPPTTDRGDG
jgi:Trypsin-co-occurring domain 1